MDFISPWAGKSYQKCNISPEWLYSLLPHFQSIVVNCVWWFVSRKQTYSSTVLRVFWWTILISLCLVRKKTWKNIASYEIVILIRDASLNIMACVYILKIFLCFFLMFCISKNSILLKTKNTKLNIEFPLVSQPLTDDGPLQALLPPWKISGCGLVT